MKTKTRSLTAAAALLMMMPMLHAGDASGNGTLAESPSEPIAAGEAPSVSSEASGSDGIVVFKLAGDGQKAPAGQWTPASLEVGVWKENSLKPLINVPVDFSVPEGSGWLARTPGGDIGNPVQILTDIDGIAQVWHRQPDLANVQSLITASALGRSVTFTTYSIAPASETPAANAKQGSTATVQTSVSAPSASETLTPPAKPTHRELLLSLATRKTPDPASGQPGGASKAKGKTAASTSLPDACFTYPADHPVGQMQRGMLLYSAAGKALELRDTEQALALAAESKGWLTLALEGESEMTPVSVARCLHYLGQIAERYEGDDAGALPLYRKAAERDPSRKQAKMDAGRIERAARRK